MKNLILLLFSLVAIAVGIGGYVYLNKKEQAPVSFDPSLAIDETNFKSPQLEIPKRISAFKRLAQKRNHSFRQWLLENFEKLPHRLKEVALEEIGNFGDDEVNSFLLVHLEETKFKLASLKGLGKIENEKRAKILEQIDISSYSSLELNQFHFSSFKANIYFSKKKTSLLYLTDKAKELPDGVERESIVNFLAISVPNFERYHELLKDLMFASRSAVIVKRSIVHLAVYETSWMKIQMKKVFASKDEFLIRAYLDRVGAVCPINFWKILDEFFSSNKKLALDYAFKMNTALAIQFINSRLKKSEKLYEIYKERFNEKVKLCY
ncbi:hypothetical protein [Halobacteriovorax sp. HLS]|uniref:hypothetical protein n=1 Tax=Halobacteriovorax sp. HLS TaxID=2234000 RepID=UPI000FDAA0EC|nr:hypothetical protein [Halobacteriovorax sp. HLS]